jgi:hypothetical protein
MYHTESSYPTPDNKLCKAVRGGLDDFTDCPERYAQEKCPPTTEEVSNEDCQDGRDNTP